MVRIGVGMVRQESNSFCSVTTRLHHFHQELWLEGDAALHHPESEVGGFSQVATERGWSLAPTLVAGAPTLGPMENDDFNRLIDRFFDRMRDAGTVDGFLLSLHGGWTAHGVDDADGYLLERLRDFLGPKIPIVVTLDLHANVTESMVRAANALIAYKTVPHIDFRETGIRAGHLLEQILTRGRRPTVALRRIPAIVDALNQFTDSDGPLAKLIRRGRELESQSGVMAVSVFPVQPWLDLPDLASSILVVTDDDPSLAESIASDLAETFWNLRGEFKAPLFEPNEAIAWAQKAGTGPLIFADTGDITTGGGTGDNIQILAALLEANLEGDVILAVVDAEVVEAAIETGIGNALTTRIGHKLDPRFGDPLAVKARVAHLSDGRYRPTSGPLAGLEASMGRAALLEIERPGGTVHVLTSTRPGFYGNPAIFRSVGIEPADAWIVCVKTTTQWKGGFGDLVHDFCFVRTQGATDAELHRLPYTRVSRPCYPFDVFDWKPKRVSLPADGRDPV